MIISTQYFFFPTPPISPATCSHPSFMSFEAQAGLELASKNDCEHLSDPSFSTSQVLGLQAYATVPGLFYFSFWDTQSRYHIFFLCSSVMTI